MAWGLLTNKTVFLQSNGRIADAKPPEQPHDLFRGAAVAVGPRMRITAQFLAAAGPDRSERLLINRSVAAEESVE